MQAIECALVGTQVRFTRGNFYVDIPSNLFNTIVKKEHGQQAAVLKCQ